jgi:tetratricopeptide (TPR) repeat protein
LAAIDAVEAALLAEPERADAWTLKRLVYADLTAAEFQAGPVGEFDAGYVEQLGRALLPDASRVRRGVELLGIAAAHRPADAPQLLKAAADALQHHGDRAGAVEVRRAARRAGQAVGAAQLPDASRRDHFATVKALAEDALARGDWAEAADCLREFADSDQSGIETLRTLAQCHEKLGDPLAALAATTRGLIYNPKDADLLERRDRYTYSVAPAALRAASEGQRSAVDADYCVAKAKELLDLRDADGELLAWARHLAELATVARPDAVTPRVLLARACARLGERDESLRLLEDVREQKPARFATSADEEAWMLAQRLLGDAYLNEVGRPDLAIACFLDYRKSHKSGADTMYKLGTAYEKLGDARKAAHFYEQAAAYDGHPLAAEAQAALRRVKS